MNAPKDEVLHDHDQQWAAIERTIKKVDRSTYCQQWGIAREEFFKQFGTPPLKSQHLYRLGALKDLHKGERIFIIGNGPSINYMPLHLLKDEYTFGVNRFYLIYDKINWKPTFYTANDWRVVPDIADEINALTGSRFFFDNRFMNLLRDGSDVYWYSHIGAPSGSSAIERSFSSDLRTGARGAGSVVGSAIQIAFHLGFDPIYLIGCDLGYKVQDTVVQEGADVFGTGVKLHLTSTKDDDINHFDPRYFGAGRRWHDPNVGRMVQGHKQCRQGIEAAGRKIYNATLGGELDVYERVDFNSLFRSQRNKSSHGQRSEKIPNIIQLGKQFRLGPFEEELHLVVEEPQIVKLLADTLCRDLKDPIMVDVGAHRGTSLAPFASESWQIIAFEPDPSNRALLEKYLSRLDNHKVTVIPMAVNEIGGSEIPFYTSEESSGISGLSAFRDTHKVTTLVKVVRLDEKLAEINVRSVNFLKIDVEGFEIGVLKSFPWEMTKPEFVVAEYEDGKTVKHGYTTATMCNFLEQKGYTVYIGEWWPIRGYGRDHSFKAFYKLGEDGVPSESWGNILAIRNDVEETLDPAFLASSILKSLLSSGAARNLKKVKEAAAKSAQIPQPVPARAVSKTSPTAVPKEPLPKPAGATVTTSSTSTLERPTMAAVVALPTKRGGQELAWKKSFPERADQYSAEFDFEIDGVPSNASYDESSPYMPFIVGEAAGYVLKDGAFRIVSGETVVFNQVGTVPRRYIVSLKADATNLTVLINGLQVAKTVRPAKRTSEFVSVGLGFQKRGFLGRFHKAIVEIKNDSNKIVFNNGHENDQKK